MYYLQNHRQALTWLIFFLLMGLQSSCLHYQRYALPKVRMPKINTRHLSFYLVDAAHPLTRIWYISSYLISEKSMAASLIRLSEAESSQVMLVRNGQEARSKKNDVLLYAKPAYVLNLADTLTTLIEFNQLEKIEVYEVNFGNTPVQDVPARQAPIPPAATGSW